ncbi:MAG: SDR family NAD(P)-dependent oxidoreductase [Woeseiaceae bacterium]
MPHVLDGMLPKPVAGICGLWQINTVRAWQFSQYMRHGAMNNLFSVADKATLVTGGTSGIGRAVASHFVSQGAKVAISGRRESGAGIATEIGARFIQADVSSLESNKQMIQSAHELLGKLDVLILNAGVGPLEKTIEALSVEEMRDSFALNFDAVFAGIHHSIPYLNEGASIIVTSSAAALTTAPTYGAYSPAKAACLMLARTAATEFGGRFRVNCVLPGPFATEMLTPDDHEYRWRRRYRRSVACALRRKSLVRISFWPPRPVVVPPGHSLPATTVFPLAPA